MYRGRRRKPRWTERDRLIIAAFEIYEATLCAGCGQDKTRSMNPDMEGFYEVHTFQCFACGALEGHREQAKDRTDLSFKEFVVDTRPADDKPRDWALRLTPEQPDEATTDAEVTDG